MFKLFSIVFAAILALAAAAPKPGIISAYSAPLVASAYGSVVAPAVAPAVAYSAPLAYSAPVVAATPLAYSGQINPLGYATYAL